MPEYRIVRASKRHLPALVAMGLKLWPEHTEAELLEEFERVLRAPRETAFLYFAQDEPIGFATVSMRVDYVEGSTSSPVGFLEGIFVEKAHRKSGLGALLVATAEDWARSKGATEMGSDAYARNHTSRKFHQAVGYETTKPLVHFIKKLAP